MVGLQGDSNVADALITDLVFLQTTCQQSVLETVTKALARVGLWQGPVPTGGRLRRQSDFQSG